MDDTVCPGCGVRFPPYSGPTHRYIGANAACWALHTSQTAGQPDRELLNGSVVMRSPPATGQGDDAFTIVMVDAYAAQHHGVESPQATNSVAIHLLVLDGLFRHGKAPSDAMWIRTRALRRKGTFHWLTPPPLGEALSVRHLFPGGGVEHVASREEYARSVHESWHRLHGPQLSEWYERFVLDD